MNIAYFLSGFWPRDVELWIFGAWEGLKYCDNAKYLFEYLTGSPRPLAKRIIWITHSRQVRDMLVDKGLPVYLSSSWKAWACCLRAGFIFVTHGRHDLINFLTRGAVTVNLNHALPIKHMGYDAVNLAYYKPPSVWHKKFFQLTMPYWTIDFNYSVGASEQTSHIFSSFQKIVRSRVLPFGFPRFEHLLYGVRESGDRMRWLRDSGVDPSGIKRVILYTPTFRDKKGFNHFGYGFDLVKLEGILSEHQALLFISLHPFDDLAVPAEISQNYNQHIKNIKIGNINDILSFVDILITDYSSVMFDYILLGRPIIYTQFDHEEFIRGQRGLYWDYDRVTPGHKAVNWQEVIKALGDIFQSKRDKYADGRLKLRAEIFNADYRDVNKRIAEYFAGQKS